jgi:hypothetical protein
LEEVGSGDKKKAQEIEKISKAQVKILITTRLSTTGRYGQKF